MDVMRFAIDLALLIWAAWATWAYFRWKEIADDLHDALAVSDGALNSARTTLTKISEDLVASQKRLIAEQNLNIALETEIKKYRVKEKPMACKGKKTGKGKRGK